MPCATPAGLEQRITDSWRRPGRQSSAGLVRADPWASAVTPSPCHPHRPYADR